MGKRKLFTGNRPIGNTLVKSRRVARKITTEYHSIQNEMSVLQDNNQKEESVSRRITELEGRLENIGGIDKYQQASIISTSHFKTSRWVVRSLNQLQLLLRQKSNKLKVLEVGAINIQLHSSKFLEVRSIDLNSQHPLIEEIDFFDIDPTAYYDVVVCSMVINCVPLAQKRGEMLARLSAHLGSNGILFLVLPSRCINSPEIGGVKVFSELLLDCGLTEVKDPNLENKTSPKLTFFILKNTADFVELKEKSLNSSSGDGSSLILKKMLDKSKANIKTRNIEYQDKFILFNNKEKKKNQNSKNFDIKFV